MGENLPKELKNEVASIQRDDLYSVYTGTMPVKDEMMLKRGLMQGLKLYEDVERDSQAYALLQKRRLAVLSKEWRIEPASEDAADVKAADIVRQQMKGLKFNKLCDGLLDANLKGFAVGEIMWEVIGSEIVAKNVIMRDQARFVFGVDNELRLLTQNSPSKGEELPENKFITHTFGSKHDNPYGIGLGNKLYWLVFFKRKGTSFWLVYSEKFGNPTTVGKYGKGANAEEKRTLMNAMRSMSNDSAVTIPENMAIELLEAKRSGSFETYERLCAYMDKQMSIAVLGETMTTDVGNAGSRAAGQVHNDIRLEIVKADTTILAETLEDQLFRPIVEYNVPNAKVPQIIFEVDEEEDLNARADIDKKLFEVGYEPTEDYVREHYGDGYVKKQNIVPLLQNAADEGLDEFSEAELSADELLASQVDDVLAPSLDGLLDQFKQRLNNAESLQEFKESLPGMYQEMNEKEIAELLADGLIVAELTGMGDAMDEGNK